MTTPLEIPPLQRIFLAFANYGKGSADLVYEMDSKAFAKMARDSGLVTKQCSPTDVDIFFTKVKETGERRIDFKQFNAALDLMAQKKGKDREQLVAKILEVGGPRSNATHAQYTKFHDDKSTYTGVYKNGGPTNYDGKRDLQELMDRTPGNVRGVSDNFGRGNAQPHRAVASFGVIHEKRDAQRNWNVIKTAVRMKRLLNQEAEQTQERRDILAIDPEAKDELKQMFLLFASYGKGSSSFTVDMDNKNWIKMCRDCELSTPAVTEVELDLYFAKVKYKGSRKIDYNQFRTALGYIADKQGVSMDKITDKIVRSGGPISYSTRPEFVPFHDDKTTYTGASKYGDHAGAPHFSRSSSTGRVAPPPEYQAPMLIGGRRHSVAGTSQPAGSRTSPLYEAFVAFANYGKGTAGQTTFIDSKNLQKLAKDCKLTAKSLTMTDIDLIFTKAKEKGKRTMSFDQFVSALYMFAEKKGVDPEVIIRAVSTSSGPVTPGPAR